MQEPTFEKYAHFRVEDFLQDAYFQHWVKSDDVEVNAFWQGFLLSYPHQEDSLAEAYKLAKSIRYKPYRLSKARQDKILEQVYGTSSSSGSISIFNQKRYLAVAASLSLVLVSVLFWLFYPTHETYTTGYRESRTVKLADGSEVTLNANTTIRVDINTDENQPRQVWLEGEAYFHVKHLENDLADRLPKLKKFVVHTDNFDIEVLGTVFNASNRERKSKVYLQEGKVKVASEKIAESQVLEPGDQLALSEEDQSFRINRVGRLEEPAWKENYFVFENTPLREVAQSIEQYYGIEVILTDPSLPDKIFTAKVSRDDLAVLLQALEASFGVQVSSREDQIRIGP